MLQCLILKFAMNNMWDTLCSRKGLWTYVFPKTICMNSSLSSSAHPNKEARLLLWLTLLLLFSSEYVDSLASYKKNANRPGSRNAIGKSRQQVPPEGASSLNPPRSPRFTTDRYQHQHHSREGLHGGVVTTVDSSRDWYDPKDATESV